ncbi:MAG: hypothetical protein K9N23_04280, partial [Akkermansiaceae bacterium]|nr:hypothetical protein [Akkermansiaceae bacterium]
DRGSFGVVLPRCQPACASHNVLEFNGLDSHPSEHRGGTRPGKAEYHRNQPGCQLISPPSPSHGSTGGELIEGVTVVPLDDEQRRQHGVPGRIGGLIITDIDPASVYAGSLSPGIVLIEINDQRVDTLDQARKVLRNGINKIYLYSEGRVGYVALRIN